MDYVQDAGPSECFVESGKAASEVARNVIPNLDSPRQAYIIKWKNRNDQGDWAPFDCNTPVLAVSTPSHPDQSYEVHAQRLIGKIPEAYNGMRFFEEYLLDEIIC